MASRQLRWWRGALLALLVLLITGVVASWAILRVYGPRFTRDRVEAALSEALGQPVHVGAVQLRPWLARLSLADLATESSAASADRVRLRVPGVDVIVGVDSLWKRELVLSVVLSDVDLEVESSLGEAGGAASIPLARRDRARTPARARRDDPLDARSRGVPSARPRACRRAPRRRHLGEPRRGRPGRVAAGGHGGPRRARPPRRGHARVRGRAAFRRSPPCREPRVALAGGGDEARGRAAPTVGRGARARPAPGRRSPARCRSPAARAWASR